MTRAALILGGVVFSVLVGCTVPEPANVEVDAPDGADEALAVVVAEWSARVPHAARLDVADLPPVRWFQGPCLDYGDECPSGGYAEHPWAAPEIHLVVRPAIHESSLSHEVLHWVLDEVAGDSDGKHLELIWSQVADVNAALVLL